MVITLSIPDALYAAYLAHNPQNPQKGLVEQLERFRGFSPKERVLVFPSAVRQAVEKLYGQPIEDPVKFAEWLSGLVSVKVGDVEVELSEGQRKRLLGEAQFYGRETSGYVQERVGKAVRDGLGGY